MQCPKHKHLENFISQQFWKELEIKVKNPSPTHYIKTTKRRRTNHRKGYRNKTLEHETVGALG